MNIYSIIILYYVYLILYYIISYYIILPVSFGRAIRPPTGMRRLRCLTPAPRRGGTRLSKRSGDIYIYIYICTYYILYIV